MSLPFLRKVPRTPTEWADFHWQHYKHHKTILEVIQKKTNKTQLMPPLFPVPGNVYTPKLSYWHQILHQQMDTLSGDTLYNFLHTDLSNPEGQKSFIETNYKNHFAFDQLVG